MRRRQYPWLLRPDEWNEVKWWMNYIYAPWKWNIAPGNLPSQKESILPNILFQGSNCESLGMNYSSSVEKWGPGHISTGDIFPFFLTSMIMGHGRKRRPRMKECPLKREHLKRNFHLPTMNFQGDLLVFKGGRSWMEWYRSMNQVIVAHFLHTSHVRSWRSYEREWIWIPKV